MSVTMSLIDQIDKEKVPVHVAVIMDGNGRWAKKQGKLRVFGHNEGTESVRAVLEAADDIGVKYLTLFAFSMENWNRPKYEVDSIMSLMVRSLKKELKGFMEKNVRFLSFGNLDMLSSDVRRTLEECIETTKHNTGINLVIALSYGSRAEIVRAAKMLAADVKNGLIHENEIDDARFSSYLYTHELPDPELLIRTSGEYRISNYLLWQIAYAELFFTDVLWPDFRREHFFEAIVDYQKRERRFGKTSEQIKKLHGKDKK